eukprot:5642196-Pleurochrysis_carterae.AAC.1
MVCTYAGQVIMGGCLQIELAAWKRTALTRLFALGPALAVGASTINNRGLFNNVNEYLNILQSVQLPFAMLPALHFASSPKILGMFVSGTAATIVSYVLAIIVIVTNIVLVVQFIDGFPPAAVAAVAVYAVLYFVVCARLMLSDDTLSNLRHYFVDHASLQRSRTRDAECQTPTQPLDARRLPLSTPSDSVNVNSADRANLGDSAA